MLSRQMGQGEGRGRLADNVKDKEEAAAAADPRSAKDKEDKHVREILLCANLRMLLVCGSNKESNAAMIVQSKARDGGKAAKRRNEWIVLVDTFAAPKFGR